jgi:hypothetical protein
MLNRILYDPQSGRPVELSQDFLRSDYARIHTESQLERVETGDRQDKFLEASAH